MTKNSTRVIITTEFKDATIREAGSIDRVDKVLEAFKADKDAVSIKIVKV